MGDLPEGMRQAITLLAAGDPEIYGNIRRTLLI
jgi:hypothetical protein